VRAKTGVPAQTENHVHAWVPPADNKSTMTSVIIPMRIGESKWGQLEWHIGRSPASTPAAG
jgi:hypothetical protein